MSFGEETMTDQSTLNMIFNQALAAYPTDANRQILEFITSIAEKYQTNVASNEKEVFMEAWSRCLLKSKAFGTKVVMKSSALCDDLILELTYNSKDASKLSDLLRSFSKEDTVLNTDSKSLRTMASIGTGLLSALNESHNCPSSSSIYACSDEAIMAQRQRQRMGGSKRSWIGRGRRSQNMRSSYRPLSGHFFGSPELIFGCVELKQGKKATSEKEKAPVTSSSSHVPVQTLSIVGVKFSSARGAAINRSRAWAAHNFLTEVTSVCGNISIFPSAIGVETFSEEVATAAAGAGDVVFVYECHNSLPLLPMLGMRLATFLRERPSLVLTWCRQLSLTVAALLRPDVRMLRPLLLEDLSVRDDGLLALGDIAIIKDENGGLSSKNQKSEDQVLEFVKAVMTSTLSLSRLHTVNMGRSSKIPLPDEQDGDSLAEEEEVISIVEGSTLELAFTIGSSSPLRVCRRQPKGGHSDVSGTSGTVFVDIFDELEAATSIIDDVMQTLRLCAIKAGHLLIQCSSSGSSSRQGTPSSTSNTANVSCNIRVVIFKATPILSLDLIELTSLLETSYVTRRHVFRNAKCFEPQIADGLKREKQLTEMDEAALTRDWKEIKQMLSLDAVSISGP